MMQWGVKSRRMIKAGSYITNYTGMRKTEEETLADEDGEMEDEYNFVVNTGSMYAEDFHDELKEVVRRDFHQLTNSITNESGEKNEVGSLEGIRYALEHFPKITIDAKSYGSIGRFINHSVWAYSAWDERDSITKLHRMLVW